MGNVILIDTVNERIQRPFIVFFLTLSALIIGGILSVFNNLLVLVPITLLYMSLFKRHWLKILLIGIFLTVLFVIFKGIDAKIGGIILIVGLCLIIFSNRILNLFTKRKNHHRHHRHRYHH